MKRIFVLLIVALLINLSVCVNDADAIFWFWYNPNRALIWFCDCWLEDTNQCVECQEMDLNKDGIVNFADFNILVGQ